ncbi:hypothetical protein [Chitinophaga sp. S165]|uniref:hypothetical protein n=1 Tax=Chitinophaga sp. S165 TaxID=2135462 RepID=UPI000D7129E4|nr:hypothetical protein [Chitinophaga sp. S165]PWV56379.1 hypothetical protein C7475_101894 [Chitinophaga sp. S165]
MGRPVSRRKFIFTAATGGIGLATSSLNRLVASTSPFLATKGTATLFSDTRKAPGDDLYSLSHALTATWASTLLGLQEKETQSPDYGGIRCPGYHNVHGRIGDTIYPFMHMARRTGDTRYLDAAVLLFRWMEANVSQPDGSWLNEKKDSWKGTTVFTVIALCDALQYHGDLMDTSFKNALHDRLLKAGEFIDKTVNIDYGNINYPISASYALSLLDTLYDQPKFREKGKLLAHQSMKFFSRNNRFVFGEGTPYYEASKKGCFSVDLGYNVEESLPNLALYGLLNRDEEILEMVTASLQTHMEFMLPDGGWDNSWGTRNYKWTYWGSRTSDGCQPAYALLADRDPRFYRVALKNTQLLQQCTTNGLLQGGPHYNSHHVPTSVHHTFCHIKALTTILDHKQSGHSGEKITPIPVVALLPRETAYGLRFFEDIQTWLVATGKFRATVTGYDREYKAMHNGHASGGALTMLWHEQTGPLLVASMNAYQLVEKGNMQADNDPHAMPLTVRAELTVNGITYMNISCLDATVSTSQSGNKIIIRSSSRLVDQDQNDPPQGAVHCHTEYIFSPEKISLSLNCDKVPVTYRQDVRVVVPVIAASTETVEVVNNNSIKIHKNKSLLTITADQPLNRLPVTADRIFNFVPGLEAVPLAIARPKGTIVLTVE